MLFLQNKTGFCNTAFGKFPIIFQPKSIALTPGDAGNGKICRRRYYFNCRYYGNYHQICVITHNTMKISLPLFFLLLLPLCNFGDAHTPPPDNCNPNAKTFDGYTFIHPGIIQQNAAYAPYLVRFGDYYNNYLESDIAKNENLREWQSRFCYQSPTVDVDRVVYLASRSELQNLFNAAGAKAKEAPAPFQYNLFANQIVQGGCTEVPEYLMFASSCQVHVTPRSEKWTPAMRDSVAMANLIKEGLDLFKHTQSHFLKQRIAYQVVRLAHYNRSYQQVIELYNYCLPKIDRRKRSIIYFWTIGHLAGALQKMGKNAEAAYRYMLVFRNDPGKRATAHRSFYLKNDIEWKQALALCQNDAERASMFILRAAASRIKSVDDLKAIYKLDPSNPQLGLLLVATVQSLEKVILNNQFTELKNNQKPNEKVRNEASLRIIELQEFTNQVIQQNKADNIKLWRCMNTYLSILRFDDYQAETGLRNCRSILDKKEDYDKELTVQLDIWEHLLTIHKLRMDDPYAEDAAFRIRSYAAHMFVPQFEPYLKERLAVAFGKSQQPGKAVLTAFDKKALLYHPKLDQLDDLIGSLGNSGGPTSAIETDMGMDSLMRPDLDFYLDAKGMALLSMAQPEAALQIMRRHTTGYSSKQFSPFKEYTGERTDKVVADSVNVTREQLAEKILEYQFAARANFANPELAAKYNYLLGLCYYNCSYFGYSWQAFDAFRSGQNWTRINKGPVFGSANTPYGNLEILDMRTSINYFELALQTAQSEELRARATFMLARCKQKQWFCDQKCNYRPGNKEIPVLPEPYVAYQQAFLQRYSKTKFYQQVIEECKWYAAYARRK
jgi:hypothetical protein